MNAPHDAFLQTLLQPLPQDEEPVVTPEFEIELAQEDMNRKRLEAITAIGRYVTLRAVAEIRAREGDAA